MGATVGNIIDLKNTTGYIELLKAYRELLKRVNLLSETACNNSDNFVPLTRTITINGITRTLQQNRSWTIDVQNNFTYNEPLIGSLNGSNSTFLTQSNFIPETIELFSNGIKLKIIDDYNTIGNNTIQLTFSPTSTENLTVNYKKL